MHEAQRIKLLPAHKSSFLRVSGHRPNDGLWSNAEIREVTNNDCRHKVERDPPAAPLEHRGNENDGKKFADGGTGERESRAEIRFVMPREKGQSDKTDRDGVHVSAAGKLPNDQRVPGIQQEELSRPAE